MNHLINPDSISNLSISLISRHSHRSKIIYLVLLLSLVFFAISLFFVSVDINIQCRGIITTRVKQGDVKSPIYGKLIHLKLLENAYVKASDTLAIVDTMEIHQSIDIIKNRLELVNDEISDLVTITKSSRNKSYNFPNLITLKYQQETQRFIADIKYQRAEIDNLKKEYERQKQLYDNKVIPQTEYEQSKYRLENAQLRHNQLVEIQLVNWQDALKTNINQQLSLKESLNNLEKERLKCFITAPLSGYVQNLVAIQVGAAVFPNQELCRISPNDDLLVEMYISPTDIGYVYEKQKVKYRIDSFNANQWGMLDGSILEISNDISTSEGQVYGFKVHGNLNGLTLQYDGKTAQVRKGMTLTANLILTQRTIAQLLFDDISDWLNPSSMNKNQSKR